MPIHALLASPGDATFHPCPPVPLPGWPADAWPWARCSSGRWSRPSRGRSSRARCPPSCASSAGWPRTGGSSRRSSSRPPSPCWSAARLADAFGRLPVFLSGMALFLAGSCLCGAATSFGALVAFRVVQGLGAGALTPIAMTISADLYTLAERARVQALLDEHLGRGQRGRPAHRRVDRAARLVAVGVPRQRARRGPRRGAPRRLLPRSSRAARSAPLVRRPAGRAGGPRGARRERVRRGHHLRVHGLRAPLGDRAGQGRRARRGGRAGAAAGGVGGRVELRRPRAHRARDARDGGGVVRDRRSAGRWR